MTTIETVSIAEVPADCSVEIINNQLIFGFNGRGASFESISYGLTVNRDTFDLITLRYAFGNIAKSLFRFVLLRFALFCITLDRIKYYWHIFFVSYETRVGYLGRIKQTG